MQKGLISRYIIFQILKSLRYEKINYDFVFAKNIKNIELNSSDINLIHNVVLTSMRYNLEIDQIIRVYTKRINENSNSYFLILSGIAQIVFLNFKDYAVIHSSVEIAKNNKFLKIYPAFINGLLRNIARNKKELSKIKVSFSMLPQWFKDQAKNWNEKLKTSFVKTIKMEPNIHLVFKNSEDLEKFKLLRSDIAWVKEAVEKLHRRLYNPDDGVVVKVNKNTEFRRDLEKQREQGKGIGTVRSDLRQLITWKSSINRAMWIAYSLLLGLMLKLLFNIGF